VDRCLGGADCCDQWTLCDVMDKHLAWSEAGDLIDRRLGAAAACCCCGCDVPVDDRRLLTAAGADIDDEASDVSDTADVTASPTPPPPPPGTARLLGAGMSACCTAGPAVRLLAYLSVVHSCAQTFDTNI